MPYTSAPLGATVPDREGFHVLAGSHRVIPVTRRLLADAITPVGLYATVTRGRTGSFLLESAEHGRSWSRWSFVGVACPTALTEEAGRARWLGPVPAGLPTDGDPLEVLSATLEHLRTDRWDGLPPLTGGLVGYLGYDMARRWIDVDEQNPTPDEIGAPDLVMLVATDLAALDHHEGTVTLIANVINWDGTDGDSDGGTDRAYDEAVARLDSMTAALAQPIPLPAARFTAGTTTHRRRSESADFEEAVARAQDYIAAGEASQIVLSQRFDADLPAAVAADPLRIYRVLRATNPSPYMYLLQLPTPDRTGVCIVGSSPESLVTVRDGRVSTHPIAGTRRRGADEAEDARLAQELLADRKEHAEHMMLVDSGQVDLRQMCDPESVRVTELAAVERYSHVMHIVSTITGDLAPGRSALDAVTACFPAGTLSGAPRARAVQIIDELEPVRRGPYGGVVGYLDFAGDADTAIAIRTAVIRGDAAHVQAGAGVVAESVPATEDLECRNKAAAVLAAIAAAGTFQDLT